jgi:hypothetical protein
MSSDNNDLRFPELLGKIIYIVLIIVAFIVIANSLKNLIDNKEKDDDDTTSTTTTPTTDTTTAPTTDTTTAPTTDTTTAPTTDTTTAPTTAPASVLAPASSLVPAPTTTEMISTDTLTNINNVIDSVTSEEDSINSEMVESEIMSNLSNNQEQIMSNLSNSQEEMEQKINHHHKTKNIYKKYEEIILPSSLKQSTGGYIPAHFVRYREKSNNINYIKKRPHCMACQVDNRQNKNSNYDNTMTNISVTCPYSDENIKGVFTKEDCIQRCSEINDLED